MEATVDIRPGRLRGRRTDGVHVFKGIPYAAPPFGPHRLQPPQPVQAWSGVRDALAWGAKPPQSPYPAPFDVLIPERDVPGEDCLTLNEPTAGPAPPQHLADAMHAAWVAFATDG